MPNTGTKIVLTLRQRNLTTNTLTGLTKPNVPGDPDYIPPSQDLTECPLEGGIECPVVIAFESSPGNLFFEFSVPASVWSNPNLAFVVLERDGLLSAPGQTIFPVPGGGNYFSAFLGLAADTYALDVVYLDIEEVELGRCEDVASVVIT